MKFNSMRFKASILYSSILALILIIFSTIIFFSVHKILYHDLDQELRIKAEEIAEILNAYKQAELAEEPDIGQIISILKGQNPQSHQRMIVDDLWKSKLNILNLKNDFINILNIRGAVLLNSNNFKGDVETLFKKQFPFVLDHVVYKNLINVKYRLRAINLPVKFYTSTLIIQVGTSSSSIRNLLYKLLMFMIIAVILLLIFTSFVGRIFIDNALRPVKEVSDLANTISHKDLNQRIGEKKIDSEMKLLVTAFNSMISRLAQSFGHINEFSSLAAHELKTPLAILRGEIELALESDKTVENYKKLLESNLEEIDHMVRVVKDLLLLAKFDYKPEIFKFENFKLRHFLEEIYEHSKVLAETKNIKMNKNLNVDNVLINADKVHLRRLFFNIISNAIKFTESGGAVAINASLSDKKCSIDVIDSGEGISENNINKIFDKFFRVYKDHDWIESGVGLGLNIAQSIAKAHNAEIQVKSVLHEGTTFTVILPLV